MAFSYHMNIPGFGYDTSFMVSLCHFTDFHTYFMNILLSSSYTIYNVVGWMQAPGVMYVTATVIIEV